MKKGPILIEVTRSPQALRTTPMLLAVTPLPSPLTTPPVTNTYFILPQSPNTQDCAVKADCSRLCLSGETSFAQIEHATLSRKFGSPFCNRSERFSQKCSPDLTTLEFRLRCCSIDLFCHRPPTSFSLRPVRNYILFLMVTPTKFQIIPSYIYISNK